MRQVPLTLPGPIVLSILLPVSGRLGLIDLSVQAAACGIFIETYPTQRSANMHIAKPYRHRNAGRQAWVSRPLLLKPGPLTSAGGSGAAGLIPYLRHQPQSYFSVKKSRSRYKHGIYMYMMINVRIYITLRYSS